MLRAQSYQEAAFKTAMDLDANLFGRIAHCEPYWLGFLSMRVSSNNTEDSEHTVANSMPSGSLVSLLRNMFAHVLSACVV